MPLTIVTGASKGLGFSLVKLALDRGQTVMTISRSPLHFSHPNLTEIQQDLSVVNRLPDLVSSLFKNLHLNKFNSINLINNAGIVTPVGPAAVNATADIRANIETNLLAPMVLTSEFLKHTKEFKGWRTITFVSSGVAERPKPTWSAYSAAKAGLKAYAHALAGEFSAEDLVRIVSFSPGIMDTPMQELIRAQSSENFPEVERFRAFKRDHQLLPSDAVANTLLDFLKNPEALQKVDLSI